jgi:thiosulfate/3-mercaptopyruvate sulfurtransferase
MKNGLGLHRGVIALTLVAGAFSARAQFSAPGASVVQAGSAASIPQAQLLQPEALHQLLLAPGSDKPLVLQVGSHILFAEAHIPGSEYVGPGSRPQGLELLQSRLAPLSRKTLIVLYCGCCPWGRCPNVGPAFAKAHEMGFTNVEVLYLADNFGADWVSKGYPVEKGR